MFAELEENGVGERKGVRAGERGDKSLNNGMNSVVQIFSIVKKQIARNRNWVVLVTSLVSLRSNLGKGVCLAEMWRRTEWGERTLLTLMFYKRTQKLQKGREVLVPISWRISLRQMGEVSLSLCLFLTQPSRLTSQPTSWKPRIEKGETTTQKLTKLTVPKTSFSSFSRLREISLTVRKYLHKIAICP